MSFLEQPAFDVAGETFSWRDVVLAGRLRGDWGAVEESAAQGLACVQRVTASGEELDPLALERTEVEFRRARNLLSGEETIEWLGRYGLTITDWRDYIGRVVARDRWADELVETAARFPASIEHVTAVAWAEAACSGALDRLALRLASDAALAVESGESLAGAREQAFVRIAAAAAEARAATATDEAVCAEVGRHELEWLRVEGQFLEVPTESMAREAALLVRDDGRPIADVAAECGTEARALRLYLAEAPPELCTALIGAHEGEIVGPVAHEGGFVIALIETKARPSMENSEVRAKAEQALIARLTERATVANVSWHGHV